MKLRQTFKDSSDPMSSKVTTVTSERSPPEWSDQECRTFIPQSVEPLTRWFPSRRSDRESGSHTHVPLTHLTPN